MTKTTTPIIRPRRKIDRDWMSPEKRQEEETRYTAALNAAEAARDAALDRFEAVPDAKYAFHLHHERLIEPIKGNAGTTGLTGAMERIDYVMREKPLDELVARFRLMRPIPNNKLPSDKDIITLRSIAKERMNAAATKRKDKRNDKRGLVEIAYYDLYDNPTPKNAERLIATTNAYVADNAEFAASNEEYAAAKAEYDRLLATAIPFTLDEIDALHKELCEPDCPWDGHTILPASS